MTITDFSKLHIEKGNYHLVNTDGECIDEEMDYNSIYYDKKELLVFARGEGYEREWGLFDKESGALYKKFDFDDAARLASQYVCDNYPDWCCYRQGKYHHEEMFLIHNCQAASPFFEGFARVKKNGKWGFIDAFGFEMIDYLYEDAKDFSPEGLAPVCSFDEWGYIDVDGENVINQQFSRADVFKDGKARVFTDEFPNGFYIDTKGNRLHNAGEFEEPCEI